jgi:hypothetical protein
MQPKSERMLYLVHYLSLWSTSTDVTTSVLVCANHHGLIDRKPPSATLFLHEDEVACTLAFELDLQRWRLAEVCAGRGDPGRPRYENVFPVSVISWFLQRHQYSDHILGRHTPPLA